MKKKLCIALIFSAVCLLIVPAINLHRIITTQADVKWWRSKVLYNMDFLYTAMSSLAYPLGISIDPNRVIIGKQGWLFLGDDYAQSISSKRMGVDTQMSRTLDTVTRSAESWNQWLTDRGVAAFRIVVGPDKDSVYPEYLPDWSTPSGARPTDELLNRLSTNIYIDPTRALIQAKADYSHPLYYKTDTHWNNLGAWIAFEELGKNLTENQADLTWPNASDSMIVDGYPRAGGDLSQFLRIQTLLTDKEVSLDIQNEFALPVEHHDFNTGETLFTGQNIGIASPTNPLLVTSPKALNPKKVLWLRDSFGSAMSPYMAATFSEILHVYYPRLTPQTFAALVERYQPDYVLVTSVERDSRSEFFQAGPPMPDLVSAHPKMDE